MIIKNHLVVYAESSPVNHLLTGSYTNVQIPIEGMLRIRLFLYRRILDCHDTGENRPSLAF
jgi:hypothetical protein